jgi:hypothetical protein
MPQGSSPPLHVHFSEDEAFYVLDGELTFRLAYRHASRPVHLLEVSESADPLISTVPIERDEPTPAGVAGAALRLI